MDGRYDKTLVDLCNLIAEARPVDVVKFAAEYFEEEQQHEQVQNARSVRCLRFFHTREELFREKVAALYSMLIQAEETNEMKVKSFHQLLRMLAEHIPVGNFEAVQQFLQQRYAEHTHVGFKEVHSCLWAIIFSQRVVWYICQLLEVDDFANCGKHTVLDRMHNDLNVVPSAQQLRAQISDMLSVLQTNDSQISQSAMVMWLLQRNIPASPQSHFA